MQQLQISGHMQKPVEYELFAEWMRYKRLKGLKVVDAEDVKDATLLQIETQKEFSERYDVTQHQLSRWKRRPEFQSYIRSSVNQVLAEIDGLEIKKAFIARVKKDPSATNFLAYLKAFEAFKEGTEHSHTVTPVSEEKPDWILTSKTEEN